MNIENRKSKFGLRVSRRPLIRCMLLAGVFLCVLKARAQTNSSSAPDFNSFRIITQRNIFDPNRSGIGRPFTRHNPSSNRTIDAFALVGTMSYEKGKFAFFDGA